MALPSRSTFWIATAALFAAALTFSCGPRANHIRDENALPGTTAWQLDGPISDDGSGQIQGYASLTSVDQGDTIDLHITVSPAQDYWIEIYRMGWYEGDGGRLMQAVGPLAGATQPACPTFEGNSSVSCAWAVGHSVTVPLDWTTGIYLAKLINTDGYQSYVMFVVRDDDLATADLFYQQAVTTYQSYNKYPGNGASFYSGGSPPWARALSFDRPYGSQPFLRNNESPFGAPVSDGSGGFFTWDFPMLQWLEQRKYRVAYATNIDLHSPPVALTQYRSILSVGHDEYWSDAMATVASNARDAGVSLAFFSGNMVFGTIGIENAPDGDPMRVMRGLSKGGAPGTLADVDFEKRQLLTGLAETGCCVRAPITYFNLPWIVSQAEHWLFQDTGFENGDSVPGLVGYEPDAWSANYPSPDNLHFEFLARSPFESGANGDASVVVNSWDIPEVQTSIYQAPSGAWVFAAGATDWPTGLAAPFGGDVLFDAAAGSGDPTTQTWHDDTSAAGTGSVVDDGGNPAWRADGSAGRATWTHKLNSTRSQAALDGYTLTAVMRVESGSQISNYLAHGGQRFLPLVRLDGSGDLIVDLEGGGSHVLASGAAATDYHEHRLEFDGTDGTFFFDDVPIETWGGSATGQSQLTFGNGSTGTAGVALYRSVSFELPPQPVPNAGIQQLTANLLNRMNQYYVPGAPLIYDAAVGDGLPVRQGWSDFTGLAGFGELVDDAGPAWRADGNAGRANWRMIASPATKSLAATDGWRLEAVLRVESGGSLTDYYADGARRFLPTLGLDLAGDLVVDLEGGGTHVLATGAAATDYHTSTVEYDPGTDLATYFFDGAPIETWAGSGTTQDMIVFGQGASSDPGSALYRSVRFEILP